MNLFKNLKKSSLKCGMILCGIVLFFSCEKSETKPNTVVSESSHGLYVLNEGVWQMNNSSISFYDFDAATTTDAFLAANQRGLGDTGSDLQKYGSKLYCVVNISETLEIMDLQTAKSLKQISLSGKQPRKITFDGAFAYLCCYDGSVLKIDTSTMAIVNTVQAGSNPDGVCVANGKLYVSNSGGLNFPNYGNSVSVFDLATFSHIKDISVGLNPTRMAHDAQGDIYIVCNGNYGSVPAQFQRIDSQTDELVETFPFPVSNFTISGTFAYLYYYDFSTQKYSVKVMDVSSETIVNENFIVDEVSILTPYAIAVNPATGDVFIADASQYTTNGDIFCFDAAGHFKYKFEAGINPTAIVFK